MTSSELAVRQVSTQTSGTITVAQENLSLGDLKEFCHVAEAHGVDDDVTVTVKESYQAVGQRSQVRVTTFTVPAPVVLAYASTRAARKSRHRSLVSRRTGLIGLVALVAVGPVMLVIDLLWKLARFAVGWL